MDKISGILIEVNFNSHVLDIQDDGYVGKLTSDGQAFIKVQIPSGRNVYGFTVDGKKNVTAKKNWAIPTKPVTSGKVYTAKMRIKESLHGIPHTEYAENNMRLLKLTPAGNLTTWEIALISQGGEFFLTVQKIYEARCYQDENKLSCPLFDKKWPQMILFLNDIVRNIEKLRPVTEYKLKPEYNADDLEKGTARVLWWNRAQGFGAIITPEGVARIHWTNVAKRPRLAFLVPGELVKYEDLNSAVQTKLRPTAFKNEVIGVELL